MDPIQLSETCFAEGFSCSQSVLRAFGPQFGLDPDTASRVAAAFGGGMARTGRICGAVSGALMVIGLRFGGVDPADTCSKESTYTLVRRFLETFAERHGAIECPALLGCDIGTHDGMLQARAGGLFKSQCPLYVRDAAQILSGMIE